MPLSSRLRRRISGLGLQSTRLMCLSQSYRYMAGDLRRFESGLPVENQQPIQFLRKNAFDQTRFRHSWQEARAEVSAVSLLRYEWRFSRFLSSRLSIRTRAGSP